MKGCPQDRAWAIVSPTAVHRITFSKALADHAIHSSGVDLQVKRITLLLGEELPRGAISPSGAYAILDRRKGKILRVSLDRETAEILCDYHHRFVREVFIKIDHQTEREQDAKAA